MPLALVFSFDLEKSFGPDGMPCVVLWRPEDLIAGRFLQRLVMVLPMNRLIGIEPQTSASENRHPPNKAIGTVRTLVLALLHYAELYITPAKHSNSYLNC